MQENTNIEGVVGGVANVAPYPCSGGTSSLLKLVRRLLISSIRIFDHLRKSTVAAKKYVAHLQMSDAVSNDCAAPPRRIVVAPIHSFLPPRRTSFGPTHAVGRLQMIGTLSPHWLPLFKASYARCIACWLLL